ncbi:MAG: cupin domain-containing protein [Chloroflexi bacterium]|nr:cupin domain-containing protein [Chloroflexota bacterium]
MRQLRKGQGLSLRALAAMSGLSFNTLSLVENGRNSPSVSTLQRLAGALRVPVAAFFEADGVRNAIVLQRKNRRPQGAFRHGTLEDLCVGSTVRRGQVLLVTLEPGADSGQAAIAHAGHDIIFCLDGRLTYVVDNRTYNLEPGDSLVFEGQMPHRWKNETDRDARSLLIMCPSEEEPRPMEFPSG